ncbi:MAG: hypothetical protein PHX61_13800 [Alphaproteobacteria bacterium]|nr:hypothetical protein [Alphaproteobacteria bacterium]
MKPLEQFICDTCHSLIEKPHDGWLEWLDDNEGVHSFRIVHHKSSCYQHAANRHVKDNHLNYFTGPENLPNLYKFLDPGYQYNRDLQPVVNNLQIAEFTEVLRRLTIPHYEEARLYFDQAEQGGFFDGANEVSPYKQDILKRIIHNYKNNSDSNKLI